MGACEGLTVTDPDLLEPMMELRESVDNAETSEELQKILDNVKEMEDACIAEIAEAFDQGKLERAFEMTTVLRYATRIKEAIIEKM